MAVLEYYESGWKLLKNNFWFLVAIVLLAAIIDTITQSFNGAVSAVLAIFVAAPVRIGAAWVMLKQASKKKSDFEDLFVVFKKNYLNAVIASLLATIFILIGLVFLIVPGIIVAVRLAFVHFLVVDKQLKAWDAITTSWNLTRGHSWSIFGMGLLAIPICLVGVLLLVVGVIPAFAWVGLAFADLYNKVAGKAKPAEKVTKKTAKK